jgi:hypothetical protein
MQQEGIRPIGRPAGRTASPWTQSAAPGRYQVVTTAAVAASGTHIAIAAAQSQRLEVKIMSLRAPLLALVAAALRHSSLGPLVPLCR